LWEPSEVAGSSAKLISYVGKQSCGKAVPETLSVGKRSIAELEMFSENVLVVQRFIEEKSYTHPVLMYSTHTF